MSQQNLGSNMAAPNRRRWQSKTHCVLHIEAQAPDNSQQPAAYNQLRNGKEKEIRCCHALMAGSLFALQSGLWLQLQL